MVVWVKVAVDGSSQADLNDNECGDDTDDLDDPGVKEGVGGRVGLEG